jgi:hypothetical protein
MRSGAKQDQLDANVRTLSQFCDTLKLPAHHLRPADDTTDSCLIQNGPDFRPVIGE